MSPEIFNENVARLEAIKPLVRVIEIALALIFIFHIYNALKLYVENKKANPQKYAIDASSKSSTFYSRYMTVTGVIILIFVFFHFVFFTLFAKSSGDRSLAGVSHNSLANIIFESVSSLSSIYFLSFFSTIID